MNLDCVEHPAGGYVVVEKCTGAIVAQGTDQGHAWIMAAEKLYDTLERIRRTADVGSNEFREVAT